MPSDPCWMTLVEAAAALRAGELTPIELLNATLSRIDAHERNLHAFVMRLPERARQQASRAGEEIARGEWRGPLHGVPIAIKDLCFTRGVVTAAGTTVLSDWKPGYDATVVEKLEDAGAVIVGKTMLTEGAFAEHHPALTAPRNPWNPDVWTGVSSSGSGVAVAAGLCFGALGSDTGGSIRFPSASCGITGVKPTWGRVSRYGVFPLAESLDHVGPMTRCAADAAVLLEAIAGHDPRDPTSLRAPVPDLEAELGRGVRGMRIGVDDKYIGETTQPEVAEAVHAAGRAWAELGAELVPVTVPPYAELVQGWRTVCSVEAAMAHAETFPARADEYGPGLRAALEQGLSTPASEYAAVRHASRAFRGRLAELFESIHVLLCPSMPMLPPPAALIAEASRSDDGASVFLKFTAPWDFSGSPTISLPCGFSESGLPLSVQLVGRHLDEATLCRAGHAYQQASDWHRRTPPLVS